MNVQDMLAPMLAMLPLAITMAVVLALKEALAAGIRALMPVLAKRAKETPSTLDDELVAIANPALAAIAESLSKGDAHVAMQKVEELKLSINAKK